MKNQDNKYKEIIDSFIKKFKSDNNVSAILIFGSYYKNKMDKNSDIDIYIILKESDFRERGNIWIKGVEIEYFLNPVKQIKHYLKKEQNSSHASTVNILLNSKVVYNNDNEVKYLIDRAKNILEVDRKISKEQIKMYKYSLDDLKRKLENVYLKKDVFTFYLIAHQIILKLLDFFCKIESISKEENKEIGRRIIKKDVDFYNLFIEVNEIQEFEKKYKALNKLIIYIEKKLGGKKTKEWKIRTKCSYK
ncbi:nucleotidyltransferase domain-containing protein [bacterium]|nr:nucleotidyltransferase domain-containing protein [bacterium]